VIYDNTVGSLSATHFTKYCRKSGCSLQIHYGYSSSGSNSDIIYDKNALDLLYFMSSRETRFSMRLLKHFDSLNVCWVRLATSKALKFTMITMTTIIHQIKVTGTQKYSIAKYHI